MILLETQRLILRDFTLEDLDTIYQLIYADPQVKDTWSAVSGKPEEVKLRFASRYILPESIFGVKAIVIKETGELIGLMGFQYHEPAVAAEIDYLLTRENPQRSVNLDPGCLEVELTYALGRPYWKKGYALEMGQAMVAYGFETLGIGRMIQGVMATNENSINLMRRLGFRIEQGITPHTVVGILDKP